MADSTENGSLCERKEALLSLLMVEKNPRGEKNKKMKERKKKLKELQYKPMLFIDEHGAKDIEKSSIFSFNFDSDSHDVNGDSNSNNEDTSMDKSDIMKNNFPKIKLDLRYIMAPMVNQSDPCFRSLCLKYGATCVYTEMLYSYKIVNSEGYLRNRLQVIDHTFCGKHYVSRPLIVQICGNDPTTLSECMLKLREYSKLCPIDGIDFNLGCPQDRAKDGLYGSYLLDRCHWPRVFECVKAMTTALHVDNSNDENDDRNGIDKTDKTDYVFNNTIPLFCKIRICEDGVDNYKATESFVTGLHMSGASLVAIHGRTRGSAKKRRCGKADLNIIRRIAEHFKGILPIISNGNIMSREDVTTAALEAMPACGLMSAEGLLADPCLFFRNQVYNHVHSSSNYTAPCDSIGSNDDAYNGIISADNNQHEVRIKGSNSSTQTDFGIGSIGSNSDSVDIFCDSNGNSKEFNNKKMRLSNTEMNTDSPESEDEKRNHIDLNSGHYHNGGSKFDDVTEHSPVNYTSSGDVESARINNIKGIINSSNQAFISPDRASLFEEYCHLSDLFFLAGGWKGLQTRDLDFPEKIESIRTNEERECGEDIEGVGGPRHSENMIDYKKEEKIIKINDNSDNNDNQKRDDISNNGHTKQMEIARQHLSFMLEKRGHGGSVRYNHMGPYKRHTDLLNDIKNSATIQNLVLISNKCLRNVYETAFQTDCD